MIELRIIWAKFSDILREMSRNYAFDKILKKDTLLVHDRSISHPVNLVKCRFRRNVGIVERMRDDIS